MGQLRNAHGPYSWGLPVRGAELGCTAARLAYCLYPPLDTGGCSKPCRRRTTKGRHGNREGYTGSTHTQATLHALAAPGCRTMCHNDALCRVTRSYAGGPVLRVCAPAAGGGEEMTELDQMRRRGSKTGWVTEYSECHQVPGCGVTSTSTSFYWHEQVPASLVVEKRRAADARKWRVLKWIIWGGLWSGLYRLEFLCF